MWKYSEYEKIKEAKDKLPLNDMAIEVTGFSKKYFGRSDFAVENASFSVSKGQFHGFIGANGAGKTTTIKAIISAYAQYEGQIKIFGYDNDSLEAKAKIGYIPEAARFPSNMSAVRYVAYMANLSGIKRREAWKVANRLIEEVGLASIAKKSPNSFSSGQKKKVLLAQALVNDPNILIMDEPAANLDPKARIELFETLKKLSKEGKTIFLSSHILAELEKFADSITVLDGGKVAFTGMITDAIKNNKFEYKISFEKNNDAAEFKKWADKNKLTTSISSSEVIVDFTSQDKKTSAIDFISKSGLAFNEMTLNKSSLDDIYTKYVDSTVKTKQNSELTGDKDA